MGKNFTSAFVVCLFISSLPLACGDDEDDGGGNGGKGGKGGGAGTTGGTSGAAGRPGTGGTGGGGATGGTAGRGTGGNAGRGGAGAGGMTGGTAGMDGGMGGDDGGMGGVPDSAGMGGQGGEPPMATVCERYCDAGAVANCTNPRAACITTCEQAITYGISIDPGCEALLNALYECAITRPSTDWACNMGQPNTTACLTQSMAANDAFCFG